MGQLFFVYWLVVNLKENCIWKADDINIEVWLEKKVPLIFFLQITLGCNIHFHHRFFSHVEWNKCNSWTCSTSSGFFLSSFFLVQN
jgi:hypothetical protein